MRRYPQYFIHNFKRKDNLSINRPDIESLCI